MLLSAILTQLISPLGSALLGGTLALLVGFTRWRRTAPVIALLTLGWLTVWSTPIAANWITAEVATDYPPTPPHGLAQIPQAQVIVVLGGGVEPPHASNPWPDLNEAADRVYHAARLYHAARASWVVLSGGADPNASLSTEAQAMRALLLELGVPDSAIVLEDKSRNTRENARLSAGLLRERGLTRVILVTSASHMARASAHFRGEGIEVIAAPTDHTRINLVDARRFLPNADALALSARSLKEWVGQRVWR